MLSVHEVAERLGISDPTWRAYVSRGQAPQPDGRIGSTPYWLTSTIDAYVARKGSDDMTITHTPGGWHAAEFDVVRPSTGTAHRFRATWRTQVVRCRQCGSELHVADGRRVPVTGSTGLPEMPMPDVTQCGNCGSLHEAHVNLTEV